MKTIKFRAIQFEKEVKDTKEVSFVIHYRAEIKTWKGWESIEIACGGYECYTFTKPREFKSISEIVEHLYQTSKYKRSEVNVIEYPMITIHR